MGKGNRKRADKTQKATLKIGARQEREALEKEKRIAQKVRGFFSTPSMLELEKKHNVFSMKSSLSVGGCIIHIGIDPYQADILKEVKSSFKDLTDVIVFFLGTNDDKAKSEALMFARCHVLLFLEELCNSIKDSAGNHLCDDTRSQLYDIFKGHINNVEKNILNKAKEHGLIPSYISQDDYSFAAVLKEHLCFMRENEELDWVSLQSYCQLPDSVFGHFSDDIKEIPESKVITISYSGMADILSPAMIALSRIKDNVDSSFHWLSKRVDIEGGGKLEKYTKSPVDNAKNQEAAPGLADIADYVGKFVNIMKKSIDEYLTQNPGALVNNESERLFYKKLQGLGKLVLPAGIPTLGVDQYTKLIVSACDLLNCPHIHSILLSQAIENGRDRLTAKYKEVLAKYEWLKYLNEDTTLISLGCEDNSSDGSVIFQTKDLPSTAGMPSVDADKCRLVFAQGILKRLGAIDGASADLHLFSLIFFSSEQDPSNDIPYVKDMTDKDFQLSLRDIKKIINEVIVDIKKHTCSDNKYEKDLLSILSLIKEASREDLTSDGDINPVSVMYNYQWLIDTAEAAILRKSLCFPRDFKIEDISTDKISRTNIAKADFDYLLSELGVVFDDLFHLGIYFAYIEDTTNIADVVIYNLACLLNVFFTRLCEESAAKSNEYLGKIKDIFSRYSKKIDNFLRVVESHKIMTSTPGVLFTLAADFKEHVKSFMYNRTSQHKERQSDASWHEVCKVAFRESATDYLKTINKYDSREGQESEMKSLAAAQAVPEAYLLNEALRSGYRSLSTRYKVMLRKYKWLEGCLESSVVPETIDMANSKLQLSLSNIKVNIVSVMSDIRIYSKCNENKHIVSLCSTLRLIEDYLSGCSIGEDHVNPSEFMHNLYLMLESIEIAILTSTLDIPSDVEIKGLRKDKISLSEIQTYDVDLLLEQAGKAFEELFYFSICFAHKEDGEDIFDNTFYNISCFLHVFFTKLCEQSDAIIDELLAKIKSVYEGYSKNMEKFSALLKSCNMIIPRWGVPFTFAIKLNEHVQLGRIYTPYSKDKRELSRVGWRSGCEQSFWQIAKDYLDIVRKDDAAEQGKEAVASQAEEAKAKKAKKKEKKKEKKAKQKQRGAEAAAAKVEAAAAAEEAETNLMLRADAESKKEERAAAAYEAASDAVEGIVDRIESRAAAEVTEASAKEEATAATEAAMDAVEAAAEKEIAARQIEEGEEERELALADAYCPIIKRPSEQGSEGGRTSAEEGSTTSEESSQLDATKDIKVPILEMLMRPDADVLPNADIRIHNLLRMCDGIFRAIFSLGEDVASVYIIGSAAKLLILDLRSDSGVGDVDIIVKTNKKQTELGAIEGLFRENLPGTYICKAGPGQQYNFAHLITDTGAICADVTFYSKDQEIGAPLNIDCPIVVTKELGGFKLAADSDSISRVNFIMPREVNAWFDTSITYRSDYLYYLKMIVKYQIHLGVLTIYNQQYHSIAFACSTVGGISHLFDNTELDFKKVYIYGLDYLGQKILLNNGFYGKDYQEGYMYKYIQDQGWGQQRHYNYAGMFNGGSCAGQKCEPYGMTPGL